ncbi:MAG: hypothetical protein ABIQ12_05490, partial [Opitutaceae bacterium]
MKSSLAIAVAWLAMAGGPWESTGWSATDPAPHGIPKFSQVAPGVWRGGQPTAEGWRYLKSLGVKWDVKLNPERQSSDAEAEAHGIEIIYLPISWVHQILAKPARTTLAAAVSALTRTNTFVHCEHGEDRTGLVVGAYRVMIEHWTKHAAYQEMKAHGFHPLLLGL